MGISLITKGMLKKQMIDSITKVIYPISLSLENKKPQLTLTVKKKELLSLNLCNKEN